MAVDTMTAQTISHYDLVDKIAEGGMGTVYRGRDQITGEIVAIKVVPKHLLSNQVFLKRFEQEYQAARTLDHPNVVRALDFGREDDTPFLVMEFVEGESLGARIERDGALPEAEAIRIITQAAAGLDKAHNLGLIHRDVKPDNILITSSGQAKVTDLGLVKELETDLNLTRTGRGLGTPHFMAPEQFRNAKKADVRCDIYSLAATLYMMVTGDLPFKSLNPLDAWMKKINNDLPPPKSLNPEITDRVDWAIRKSMSADPAQRAGSCREFIEDLAGRKAAKSLPAQKTIEVTDWWYLVYKDDDGLVHTVKGTIEGIRRSLKDDLLGDARNVRVAPTKQGPFEPIRQHTEFRDLFDEPSRPAALVATAPDATPRTPSHMPKLPSARATPLPIPIKPGTMPNHPVFVDKPALPAPVVLNIAQDEPADDSSNDWAKYLLFMVAGMALGVVTYFLLLRIFGIRLF
jgi:serine/threonine protein kinase